MESAEACEPRTGRDVTRMALGCEFAEFPIRLSFKSSDLLSRNAGNKLAESVGVFDRDFVKPNEINGFALISRNRSNLAFSNLRRRCRPLAGFCRFFYFNGTRRERLQNPLRRRPR